MTPERKSECGRTFNDRDTWVFDLDNTLYPAKTNLFHQIDQKMGRYIQDLLNLSAEEARSVQKKYLVEEGTTLRGLMTYHDVAPQHFLDFVHDIDFSPLDPDPILRSMIKGLEGRKLVFTNADLPYAEQVLERIGIADLFDEVFDIHAADLRPKPAMVSYEKFLTEHDIDPEKSVMFEDMACNLVPAHDLGMATVWIDTGSPWGIKGHNSQKITATVATLHDWFDNHQSK